MPILYSTRSSSDFMVRFFLTILIFLTFADWAWGKTYYVRADGVLNGSNKSLAISCTSKTSALSPSGFNGASFSPGDIIRFCTEGGVYDGNLGLSPPSSGTILHPITYTSEVNQTAVINPSILLAEEWISTGEGTYFYSKPLPFVTGFEDAIPGKLASNNLLSDGMFFFEGVTNSLYYRPSTGTPEDHRITIITSASFGLNVSNKHDIIINGFKIINANAGIYAMDTGTRQDNVCIMNLSIESTAKGCFQVISGATSGFIFSNNYCKNVSYCLLVEATDTNVPSSYVITRNEVDHGRTFDGKNFWGSAWYLPNGGILDYHGLGFQNLQNSTVTENNIHDGLLPAIYLYTNLGAASAKNIIQRNSICNTEMIPIYFGPQSLSQLNGLANNDVRNNYFCD